MYVCHDYEDGKSRWAGRKTDNGNRVKAASARLGRGIMDGLLFPLLYLFSVMWSYYFIMKNIYIFAERNVPELGSRLTQDIKKHFFTVKGEG